jgi:iron complex outermembrane receptor protein
MGLSLVVPVAAVAQTPPVRLDTIVVVGTRLSPGLSQQTRAVELLDRDLLAALPVRSISQALQWAMGVDVRTRSPAQADLSIRGSSAEQVLVLVDGMPVNDRQTAHFDLDLTVPFDRVERIEILRGPASASYGTNAMGGVVNIVTRDPTPHAEGRLEGGSFGTVNGSLGAGLRIGSTYIAGGAGLSRADGHRDGTDHRASELHVATKSKLGKGELSSQAGYQWKDFGAADFYAPFPSYEETRAGTASVRWGGPLSTRVELEPTIYYRRHKDHFVLDREDPAFYSNRHTSSQVGGEVVVRYRDGNGFDLAGGTVYGRDWLVSSNLGDRAEDHWALFAEAVNQRGPFTVSLGARADHYESYGTFPSPSVSAAYQYDWLRVRGSLARSFRAPTWTERYYQDPVNQGNPDLEPEKAWTAELGADVEIAGNWWLSLTAYRRRAEDLIDWARQESGEGPWETRNVERATFYGLEGELSGGRVAGVDVALRASVLDVTVDSTAGYVSKYALRPIIGDASLGLARRFGGLRAETRVNYRRREGEPG